MQQIIEIILLSAAVDGAIDAMERETVISRLSRTKRLFPVSEEQLLQIQRDLRSKIESGHTSLDIVKSAAQTIPQEYKIFCYAVAVDVVLSNLVFEKSEKDYLNLLRELMELDAREVKYIHFSAKVRYGIEII